MISKASRLAAEMDLENERINRRNTPTCGNCDLYVDRVTTNKRYRRSEMICRLNNKHMNPKLIAGCSFHQANRGESQNNQLKERGFIK